MTEQKDPRVKLWNAWSDANTEMLKQLWREKNSASEIAVELTRRTGRHFTRNAVTGKINRLGLQGQGQLAPKFTKSKKRKPRAQEVVVPVPDDGVVFRFELPSRGCYNVYLDTEKMEATATLAAEPARLTPPDVEVVSVDLEFPSAIEVVDDVDLPISDRVTISDVGPGVCKWPIGDPLAADFTFCGDACDVTRSYCEAHHRIAYVPITKQKQVAWRAHR